MRIAVQELVFDCADIEQVAAFWSRLLERPWALVDDEWAVVDTGRGIMLGFQPVPEPKRAKNRVHLDLEVADLAATLAHAQACGASVRGEAIDREDGTGFVVCADVEGNEFCLVRDTRRVYGESVETALRERGRVERP